MDEIIKFFIFLAIFGLFSMSMMFIGNDKSYLGKQVRGCGLQMTAGMVFIFTTLSTEVLGDSFSMVGFLLGVTMVTWALLQLTRLIKKHVVSTK